jgi:Na+-translocating ferredoxin:NAD+ oxidoreductase RNF subunit RnfB
VFEDPRVDAVQSMLPNNNCGACGLPGCRAFAEKVVAGAIQPAGCTVGGAQTAQTIAAYLGVDAGQAVKRTARLLCAGGSNVAVQMAEYRGHPTCRAAAAVAGGGKACRYGCLGYGDCFDVCDFDAIVMSGTGLPIIDAEKCTACATYIPEERAGALSHRAAPDRAVQVGARGRRDARTVQGGVHGV